ncbi:hypothetical protein Tco_1335407 [Tanacetum coccineum]
MARKEPHDLFKIGTIVSKFIKPFFPPSNNERIFAYEITQISAEVRRSFYEALGWCNDYLGHAVGNFLTKCSRMLKNHESKSKFVKHELRQLLQSKFESLPPKLFHLMLLQLTDICPSILLTRRTQALLQLPAPALSKHQNQLHRPQVNQSPAYQAPVPQTHSVTKNDFDNYVKANDAIMRNMQNNLQNQGSGTLPLVTQLLNPREDRKGITTRIGVAYPGPPIPYILQ